MAWVKDYRYGRNAGPRGNPEKWRAAFKETMSPDEAKEYIGDDSPWGILGIPAGSSFATIKKAFHTLINKYHPDKWQNASQVEKDAINERAKKIIAAWTTLKGS